MQFPPLQSADPPVVPRDFLSVNHAEAEMQSENALLDPPSIDEECESMDSTNSNDGEPGPPKPEISQTQPCYPVIYPAYFSPFYPIPVPYWCGYGESTELVKKESHEVVKPTAVHSKSPINVDELVGMSKLSLREPIGHDGPSPLSLKLSEGSTRQSAFHANPSSSGSTLNPNGSPIHAA